MSKEQDMEKLVDQYEALLALFIQRFPHVSIVELRVNRSPDRWRKILMGYSVTIPYTEPAAATIANILAGQPPEFIGEASKLTLYGSCDTAGDTHQLVGFRGGMPGELLVPLGPIPAASTAGAVKTNENFIGQWAIPAGTRLVHNVNGTAAHVGRFLYVLE